VMSDFIHPSHLLHLFFFLFIVILIDTYPIGLNAQLPRLISDVSKSTFEIFRHLEGVSRNRDRSGITCIAPDIR
jgi:hypothetical protein